MFTQLILKINTTKMSTMSDLKLELGAQGRDRFSRNSPFLARSLPDMLADLRPPVLK